MARTTKTLTQRMTDVEVELAKVKMQLPASAETPLEDVVWGAFAGDPMYLEAMRLGREYRESLRPTEKSKRRRSDARPRH